MLAKLKPQKTTSTLTARAGFRPDLPSGALPPDLPAGAESQPDLASRNELPPDLSAGVELQPDLASGSELPPDLPALEVEIRLAMEDERMSLKALYRQLARTRDEETRLEIEARIGMVKEETELTILRIQLGQALRAGRGDVASRLEEAIRGAEARRFAAGSNHGVIDHQPCKR